MRSRSANRHFPALIVLLCLSAPPRVRAQDSASVDYGACPIGIEAIVAEKFKGNLLVRYADDPVIFPAMTWSTRPRFSEAEHGYLVPVGVYMTRGPATLRNSQVHAVLVRGDSVLRWFNSTVTPGQIPHRWGPLPIPEAGWKQAHEATRGAVTIIEWTRSLESVESWTELVSMQTFPSFEFRRSIEWHLERVLGEHKKVCATAEHSIVSSSPIEVLYTQVTRGCERFPDEWSVRKLLRGPYGSAEFSYATRAEMSEAQRTEWLERLGTTSLLGDCPATPAQPD